MKTKTLLTFFTCFLLAFATNVRGQGGTLPLNGSVTGDLTSATLDVWNITTNADGLLRLTFTTVSPADLYVTLYDNDGTTVLGGPMESFNNSTITLIKDGLAPGTYHAKITAFSTDYGAYTLSDSLFTSGIANDAEPNGTAASADVLPLNGTKTGHVGYYYNNQRDTTDWYKVTTTADGLLRVYLTTDSASIYSTTSTNPLDVNVYLYDNDGTTQLGNVEVFNGDGPATNLITVDGLAPGTYYIKLQPYYSSDFANYILSDSLFTATLANDVEPNGTTASALTLPLNGSKTGHLGYYYNHQRDTADWYKVTTTADGLLRVYLSTQAGSVYSTTATNPLDVNVWLYDNNGTTQLGNVEVFNSDGPATNLITVDGLAPGTYYIKLQPYYSSDFANYILSDSLFTATLANDVEPNGTAATALTLPLNGGKTGHIGYYYNNQRDTSDWYKVTTTADGLLRAYLSTDSASIYSNSSTNPLDVNLYVYDHDGTTQLGHVETFNADKPAKDSLSIDGLAPGTYYIKVQPFYNSEFANYALSDTLILTPFVSDVEPNGSPATALNFPINSNAKGQVGYYYNQQRDTADWYKLTTLTNGPLYVYLNSLWGNEYSNTSNNPLDMLLYLYGSDGTTQLGSVEVFNGDGPAIDSLYFPSLTAGTYYIKVTDFSISSEFANYSLSNSSTQGNLPVTFLNFDGKLVNQTAQLTWSTATEINNKGFEVEKSTDGQNFNGIGFVNGNGTSSLVNNYNYIDTKVLSGSNYYRLKQVDIDNNFNYSAAIRLDFKNFDWAIFGNPITSNSWIQLQVAKTSNIVFQVYTIDGKLVKTIDRGTVSEGTYSVPLNLGNVSSGIYIVKLVTDHQILTKEIIK